MRLLIIIAIAATLSFGQVTSGQVDFSGASSTKPFRESASDTATCAIGEVYRNTATGLLRICGATNTWSNFTSFENSVLGRSGIPATAGLIAFASGTAGTLTTDSLLYFDSTNKRLGVGYATPPTVFTAADTSTSSPRGVMSWQSNNGTDGGRLHLRKSRGTHASPTTVAANDMLGRLVWSGYDGSNFLEMASIDAVAVGTVASTRVPTEIRFSTATDAAPSVLTQRMVLDKNGNLVLGVSSSSTKFHVYSGANGLASANSSAQVAIEDDTATYVSFLVPNNTYSGLFWNEGTDNDGAQVRYKYNTSTLSGALEFRMSASEVMRLKSDGSLGILVDTPIYSLDVSGGVGKTGTARFYDATTTTGVTRSRWTSGAAQSTVPLIATAGTESLTVGVGDNTYLTLANGGAATFTSSVTATRHAYSSLTDPANNATCTAGETITSATYFYVCTATNTWKRLELVSY